MGNNIKFLYKEGNCSVSELIPVQQKSFYKKAFVLDTIPSHENHGEFVLQSYNTIVASYNKRNGKFHKEWNGYSVTTMKHINSFRIFVGLNPIGKKEWENMPNEDNNDAPFYSHKF